MTTPSYWLANPTGNITILIEDRFPESQYPSIAKNLLAKEPTAEQAGFIEDITPHSVRLHMAGGEFCGNASLSAAALAAKKASLSHGSITVEVFGCQKTLLSEITEISPNTYSGILEMPSPEDISISSLSYDGKNFLLPIIRFPGISHIVVEEPMPDSLAESAAKAWCNELNQEALGLMMLGKENNLRPLVYVRSIDTLYWESSCASGTCATAAYLSKLHGPGRYDLKQPGGTLGAIVTHDNGVSLKLAGNISLKHSS